MQCVQGVIYTAALGVNVVFFMAVAVFIFARSIECRDLVSRHRSALVKQVPINRRLFTSALTVVICVAIITMLGCIASTDADLRKMKLDLLDGGSPTSAVRNVVVSLDRRVSDSNACGFDAPFSTLVVFKNCTFNPHLNTARVLCRE